MTHQLRTMAALLRDLDFILNIHMMVHSLLHRHMCSPRTYTHKIIFILKIKEPHLPKLFFHEATSL